MAQDLQGVVSDFETQKGISAAIVEVVDNENKVQLFATTNKQGEYSLSLKNLTLGEYSLMISKYGFASEIQPLIHQNTSQIINFELRKDLINLQDIVVKAKPKPIRVKNDTTSYHADSYKDGSERVVEDLLKKLPGVDVAENGTIKYKGREISKLLLDGDDLFSNNYVIGTKNISVDIIDQVQALENWSENPLMKDIEENEEVALNLKLKKGMTDISGNGNIGYGISDKYDSGLNIIWIDHRHKNFSTLSYNNKGHNYTPWDYFSFQSSEEQREISKFTSDKIIPENKFVSALDQKRANKNSLIFGSLNEIFRVNKEITARFNFHFVDDKLNFNRTNVTEYVLDGEEDLTIKSTENIQKQPQLFYWDSKFTWNKSENAMFEWEIKWMDEKIKTHSDILKNQENKIQNELKSHTYFLLNNFSYTQKLNTKQVLKVQMLYGQNSTPQYFQMSPDLNHFHQPHPSEAASHQNTQSGRNIGLANISLLGTGDNAQKYSTGLIAKFQKEDITTYLNNFEHSSVSNHLDLSNLQSKLYAAYIWSKNKWKINPYLSFSHHLIQYQQGATDSTFQKIVFQPSLNISYAVNENSKFIFQSKYDERRQPISNLFENVVLTSYRSLRSNEASLVFQEKFNSKLGFSNYDLYHQFQFLMYLNYEQIKNNLFSENYISQDFSRIKFLLLPKTTSNYQFHMMVEKYIPYLTSTIRFSSNYTYLNYFNLVNNSELRNNVANSTQIEMYWQTAFDIPVNFQNSARIQHFSSQPKNNNSFANTSIQNELKVLIKPKKQWFSSFSFEYFNPEIDNNNPYYFLDFDVIFRPIMKNWELTLEARNLTNNRYFEDIFISDYYKEQNTENLNNRYILLKYSFRF